MPILRLPAASLILRGLLRGGLATLVLAAAGCAEPEPDVEAAPEPEPEMLYFEPIGRGADARVDTTLEVAIRDSAAWAVYQDSLRPMAPFRPVDFSQAFVLVAAVSRTVSGASVDFESVERTDSGIVASYQVSAPGDDCFTAPAAVTPFAAVLVRRAEGPVHFERRLEEYSCTGRRR